MNKESLKKLMPYGVAVILFFIISFAYFPDVIQGKKLNQHDKKTWKGGVKEIVDYEEETDEHSLWTNSMFGGMPTYLITNYAPNNITKYIYKIIDFNHKLRPASFIFLLMLGFFISLIFFGVDPWLSIVGATAYAFSTYFVIIIEAGHITKTLALAFMPPIIAGVHYAYTKKMFVGAVVVTLFLSLQLVVNHLQITFYTLLVILIYLIFKIVETIQNKTYASFTKSSSLLLVGGIIAILTNFSQLITTYDYGKDSIRGKSELSIDKENKTSGLDKDYATAWSYGKTETLNLLIPNLTGGGSGSGLPEDSEMFKELKKLGARNPAQIVKHMPTYWGPQPFTSGPVYIGALMVFLFIFGMFIVKGNLKWWLFTVTIFSILLAWGKNFMFLTDLFLDYFPFYNKFRTVSMILIIAEFTIPLLGILAIKNIIEKTVEKVEIIRALKWSVGILAGLILILLINPGILSFENGNEKQVFMSMFGLQEGAQAQQILDTFIPALKTDRASMFRADAFRSLTFVLIGALFIWLYTKKLIKLNIFISLLALAIIIDLWAVDKRFLNSEDFQSARYEQEPFKASETDKFILKDSELNFRVLNLTVSTFNDAGTSYFHKSIGGYHGAKMRRYQELIDYKINTEMQMLIAALNTSNNELQIHSALIGLSVLNMLNTKYVIVDPNMMPMMNKFRLGNAWFVEEIKEVENADDEIKAMLNFNPERTAIVDKRFKEQFFEFKKDPSAMIELTDYKPNLLTYQTNTKIEQLAVFSEIYYGKGWNAYIDNKKVPHMRVNYVLRAMKVPAGKHKIEFKFEPQIWAAGNKISFVGSILFILFILGGIVFEVRKNKTIIIKKS